MSRTALAVTFVAGIALGTLLSWLLGDSPEPSPVVARPTVERVDTESRARVSSGYSAPPAADCPDIDSTTMALNEARDEVDGLRQKLTDRLNALRDAQAADPNKGGRGGYELRMCMEAMENLNPDPPSKRLDPNRAKDHSFDMDQMVDVGFSPKDVEWVKDRWEEAKLDKLYLSDKLSRGESARPGESFVEFERQLREDLGDDYYAAMLYSTNQMNAVSLQNVLENSEAYRAGLRNGRIIYSINGKRVFKPMELRAAIRDTRPGEVVELEIVTNDGLDRVWLDSLVGVTPVSAKLRPRLH